MPLHERITAIKAWTCGPVPNNPGAGGGVAKSFIVPGDPAQSYLVQRMTLSADPCALPDGPTPMPPIATVPQTDIDTIVAWINEGALDN